MFMRIAMLSIVLGAGWWYYEGPWQEQHNPNYERRTAKLNQDMKECIEGKWRKISMTGMNEDGDPEETCAAEHNAYKTDRGEWHSYDETRK